MNRMALAWVSLGAALASLAAAGAFVAGWWIGREPGPVRADAPRLLGELLVPARKLMLAESQHSASFSWTLRTTHTALAWLVRRLRAENLIRTEATGEFSYAANFAYGYDLRSGEGRLSRLGESRWRFEAPPIELLACPAVLAHTFQYRVLQRSLLVDEDRREAQVARLVTAQALAAGHARLRDPAARAALRAQVEGQLRAVLSGFASSIGVRIDPAEIEIRYRDGEVWRAPQWSVGIDPQGLLDDATLARLRRAGCGEAAAL